ncbi:hypothetical protein F900_01101 [Acinetobacter modestus]|uniref:Uncharacterized protein n=1 Tax=Acinetobacter modestus TaxID=1776740 RepID=N9NKY7_9GAMM|nr:hypothetical protein [Acinetobacter modestus]ENX02655.1 hypothetical protein F900_01101 [Acinetobacter modestus]
MNFEINTEVNLDMTVRITGRDQATGADVLKLNALFKAVEDLGGTITLPEPETPNNNGWELTNAVLVNGVISYTGGLFEEEGTGSTYNGLFAKKSLAIGESATVGFKFASADITYFAFAVDDGTKYGSWGDLGAVIFQNELAARLISGRDWSDEHKVDLQDNTTYTARIERTAIDTVVLSVSDLNNNLLKERIVTIAEADLKRIWLSAHFANVSTVFSTELTTQTS